MYQCERCKKEFESGKKLGGHKTSCGVVRKKRKLAKKSKDTTEYECQFCKSPKIGKNSLRQHEIRCKQNSDRFLYATNIIESNFIAYNKKRKDESIKGENQFTKAERLGLEKPIVSEDTRKKHSIRSKNTKHTEITKEKLRISMRKVVREKPESYSASNVNGRVKKIEYKGFLLDGGWELCFAKWCDDHDIKWERNNRGFEYKYEGPKIYYPDFYLSEYDLYVEIKGYERAKDLEKWKSVPNLIVLKSNQIKKIKNDTFSLFDQ